MKDIIQKAVIADGKGRKAYGIVGGKQIRIELKFIHDYPGWIIVVYSNDKEITFEKCGWDYKISLKRFNTICKKYKLEEAK